MSSNIQNNSESVNNGNSKSFQNNQGELSSLDEVDEIKEEEIVDLTHDASKKIMNEILEIRKISERITSEIQNGLNEAHLSITTAEKNIEEISKKANSVSEGAEHKIHNFSEKMNPGTNEGPLKNQVGMINDSLNSANIVEKIEEDLKKARDFAKELDENISENVQRAVESATSELKKAQKYASEANLELETEKSKQTVNNNLCQELNSKNFEFKRVLKSASNILEELTVMQEETNKYSRDIKIKMKELKDKANSLKSSSELFQNNNNSHNIGKIIHNEEIIDTNPINFESSIKKMISHIENNKNITAKSDSKNLNINSVNKTNLKREYFSKIYFRISDQENNNNKPNTILTFNTKEITDQLFEKDEYVSENFVIQMQDDFYENDDKVFISHIEKGKFSYKGYLNGSFKKSEFGIQKFTNDDIYIGHWKNDKIVGNGVYFYNTNEFFKGNFVDEKKSQGLYFKNHGEDTAFEAFLGTFQDDKWIDNGIFFSNKKHDEKYIYRGKFVENKKHDDNGLYYVFNNRMLFKGKFENDKIIKGYIFELVSDYQIKSVIEINYTDSEMKKIQVQREEMYTQIKNVEDFITYLKDFDLEESIKKMAKEVIKLKADTKIEGIMSNDELLELKDRTDSVSTYLIN